LEHILSPTLGCVNSQGFCSSKSFYRWNKMMNKLYSCGPRLADNWSSGSILIVIEIEEIWNRNKKKEIECELAYCLGILCFIRFTTLLYDFPGVWIVDTLGTSGWSLWKSQHSCKAFLMISCLSSQVDSLNGWPCHLIRYCRSSPCFLEFRILSTYCMAFFRLRAITISEDSCCYVKFG